MQHPRRNRKLPILMFIALAGLMPAWVAHAQPPPSWALIPPGNHTVESFDGANTSDVNVTTFLGIEMFPQPAPNGDVSFLTIAIISSSTNTSVASIGDNVLRIDVAQDGTVQRMTVLAKVTDPISGSPSAFFDDHFAVSPAGDVAVVERVTQSFVLQTVEIDLATGSAVVDSPEGTSPAVAVEPGGLSTSNVETANNGSETFYVNRDLANNGDPPDATLFGNVAPHNEFTRLSDGTLTTVTSVGTTGVLNIQDGNGIPDPLAYGWFFNENQDICLGIAPINDIKGGDTSTRTAICDWASSVNQTDVAYVFPLMDSLEDCDTQDGDQTVCLLTCTAGILFPTGFEEITAICRMEFNGRPAGPAPVNASNTLDEQPANAGAETVVTVTFDANDGSALQPGVLNTSVAVQHEVGEIPLLDAFKHGAPIFMNGIQAFQEFNPLETETWVEIGANIPVRGGAVASIAGVEAFSGDGVGNNAIVVKDPVIDGTPFIGAGFLLDVRFIPHNPLPDLTVTSLTTPQEFGLIGGTVEVSAVVKNIGGAVAHNPSVHLVLSEDTNIDTDDVDILTCLYGSLAPGDMRTCNGLITLVVSTLSPGTWYFLAFVDNQNLVEESDETNNVRAAGPIELFDNDCLVKQGLGYTPPPPRQSDHRQYDHRHTDDGLRSGDSGTSTMGCVARFHLWLEQPLDGPDSRC